MKGYTYSITANWLVEPMTPLALGERFLSTLDAIAAKYPGVGNWLIMTRPFSDEFIPIDGAREIIEKLLEDNIATIDGEPNPDLGYRLVASNDHHLSGATLLLSAGVGGRFGDSIRFYVGFVATPSDLTTVTFSLFKTVISTIIALWPSSWANAFAVRRDYDEVPSAPGIPPHPSSRYQIPWISYLSAPLAAGLEPPDDIQTEQTPDGGLFMIATEERLDPTDPEQMRRSRAIVEIMTAQAGKA